MYNSIYLIPIRTYFTCAGAWDCMCYIHVLDTVTAAGASTVHSPLTGCFLDTVEEKLN